MKSCFARLREADLISSEAVRRRFHPSLLGFHRACAISLKYPMIYDIISSINRNLTKECNYMRVIILIASCLALIASALMAIKLIKEKKPITDLYFILSIVTFLIALRMIFKMLGIF